MATILLSLLLSSVTSTAASTSGRTSTYTPCPQVPSLHCRNGSTCISGLAKYSSSDLSTLPNLQTHEDGYHCDCLPGFTGHECQIEVKECGTTSETYDPTQVTPVHSCYYGSNCRRHYDDSYYCDCQGINDRTSSTGSKYAGLMCEHEATSLCAVSLVETYSPGGQFCTNHGKCVKLVNGADPHPGCVCRDGWGGDRCELKTSDASSVPKIMSGEEGAGSAVGRWVMLSLLIIVMSAIAIATIYMLIKIKREQSGPKPVGKTAIEAGVGELEPDGSATLGASVAAADKEADAENLTEGEAEGDLEMKESDDGADDNETKLKGEDRIANEII